VRTEYQSEVAKLPVHNTKKQSKSKKNPWSRYFVMVFITVVIALSITGRYAAIARNGYDIAKMKSKVAALETEHMMLELNVASLKSPGRVQGIASAKLGMQLPEKVYYASATSTSTAPKKPTGNEIVRTPGTTWGTVAEARSR
jgi:cell division protein FtsL